MALVPETGSGVSGADSYATQAQIDAYWAARPHDPNAAVWAALDPDEKDGAAREATAYLDSVYGNRYRGKRAGYVQGLEHPRTDAYDDDGYPLPSLPPQLVTATCELAVRASASRLISDSENSGVVKRIRSKVDVIEEEIEYSHGGQSYPRYGFVDNLLAPLLQMNGNASWNWA